MQGRDEAGSQSAHRLKILMVATSYPRDAQAWQGKFIRDMALALSRRDDIELRLWCPPGDMPACVRYVATESEKRWLEAMLDRGGIAHLLRQNKRQGLLAGLKLLWLLFRVYGRNRDVDLVHVNWLQNALPLWGSRMPALVTVLGSDLRLLKLAPVSAALRSTLRRRRCVVCPNSDWMLDPLHAHLKAATEILEIPFGVDKHWYEVTRSRARDGRFRWLVVLRITERKMGTLFEWGKEWLEDTDELHLFGPMQEQVSIPSWVHYHGPAAPKNLLKNWYPAADGMITLSQHDEGRPQVLLEAMASGLPIIASDIDAHRNLIRDGQTGFLVDSSEQFHRALGRLRDRDFNASIGANARQWMHDTIGTWDDCADRFVRCYRQLLAGSKKCA